MSVHWNEAYRQANTPDLWGSGVTAQQALQEFHAAVLATCGQTNMQSQW